VIPPDHELLMLDTNVLIETLRDNEVGQRINAELGLARRSERPLISTVTVGEALALARQFGWGAVKTSALRELLRNLVVVDVSRPGVVEKYAEITDHARRSGLSLSDYDRWIAATTSVSSAWLITTDKDFTPLDPAFIRHTCFEPRSRR